ncbi:MAG TPA: hypothetical protein VGF29_00305 [Hyphomicrobiaceae bacterium]|jgi:hypothetical protein
MSLFHLDWYRCLDGYRIDERVNPRVEKLPLMGVAGTHGRFIVPNSRRWEPIEPMKIPGAYRQFANWDGTERGLLKLINAFGFLNAPKATDEIADIAERFMSNLALLVRALDAQDWLYISDALSRAAHDRMGIGRLAILFDVQEGNRPVLKLRPPNLAQALQVQALADATLGVEHRKCKNPECDGYFPVSGPDALRSDAEYHDEACRRRHAYLIKKASLSKRKERRQ